MKKILNKIDKFLDAHTVLWIFLSLILILRIPNFFEPYWYGDEGIYLTLGQSIRRGERLYTDIVDHKTPIIYYLASVPNQFYFRILLVFWMIASTVGFYALSRIFFKKDYLVWISLTIFALLTTAPWLEGNIPNGELFVLGFVIAGLWLAIKSNFLQPLIAKKSRKKQNTRSSQLLCLAGVFYGLAILTKVPAVLDYAAILLIPYFLFMEQVVKLKKITAKKVSLTAWEYIQKWWPLLAGTALIITASVLYFVSQGSGADYLEFGLLYNFHYTQSWNLNLGSPIVNFLYTLPIKTLILFAVIFFTSCLKFISLKFKFFLAWTWLALYAVLLSSRPYPHYLIQVILPSSFLIALLVKETADWIKTKKINQQTITTFILGIGTFFVIFTSVLLLNFGTYSSKNYYLNFLRLAKGNITQEEYYLTFNRLMSDNYQLSSYLKNLQVNELFIWGNNAMLYALSDTIPTSRFTVAFHITDLDAYEETLAQIKKEQPKFIVVMNNAPSFPQFFNYLDDHYLANYKYDHMILYKRTNHNNNLDQLSTRH